MLKVYFFILIFDKIQNNKPLKLINIISTLCLFMAVAVTCNSCREKSENNTVVDFSDTISTTSKGAFNKKPITIAIASMASPEETIEIYSDLLNYISKKIGKPFVLTQKKTYKEVNDLVGEGEVELAFICSGAYIMSEKEGYLKLVVVPEYQQGNYYNAYIITQKKSGINSFEELKNKSFAFTDPFSTTGKLYPKKLLYELQTNDRIFFKNTIYTYGHDISIELVNRNLIDAASVHSQIYHHLQEYHPKKVENIKIINVSEKFCTPPIVASSKMSETDLEKYQEIFTNLHRDSTGKAILQKMDIKKFVIPNDTMYNNVRKLVNYFQ